MQNLKCLQRDTTQPQNDLKETTAKRYKFTETETTTKDKQR